MSYRNELKKVLHHFIPQKSITRCINLLVYYNVEFVVAPSRSSKYGDSSNDSELKKYKITVNEDLNRYSFLITLIHEIAHISTWKKYPRVAHPHGLHWKKEYRRHMKYFLGENIFPKPLVHALAHFIEDPSSTSCNNFNLHKVLMAYDKPKRGWYYLERLQYNSKFKINTGRIFIKRKVLKKNIECREFFTKDIYLLSRLMMVKPISQEYSLRKAV
ncbi:MAG TPA: hypothetical protein PKH65_03395 [Bacteroidia bacterium]|nr:hypothetical protein [Bacteroidia bacterium]HNT79703.1 hypothetical protein [Bacteroidia bacterium]